MCITDTASMGGRIADQVQNSRDGESVLAASAGECNDSRAAVQTKIVAENNFLL